MIDDVDPAEFKRYENRLRRMAAGLGLVLRKSRTRDDCRMDYGCYRLETKEGRPVAGNYPYPYSLSLARVAEALDDLEDNPPDMGRDPHGNIIHGHAGAADPDWGR
jgi:hypothetical protein